MKTKSSLFILLFMLFSLNTFSQKFHEDVQLGEKYLHQGNLQQAYHSFEKAAKYGDLIGQYYWAKCFANGYGIQQDEKRAFSIYRRVAERGLPVAQAELGYALLLGKGVTKNISKGLYWINKVEENSSIDAYSSYIIGLCYENGIGKEKDMQKAMDCFSYSMSRGVDESYIHVANLFADGIKITQDITKAEQIIDEAIKKIGSAFDWACKGYIQLKQGRIDNVNKIWRIIVDKFPYYAVEGNTFFCIEMRSKQPLSNDFIQTLYAQNDNVDSNDKENNINISNNNQKVNNTIINITYANPTSIQTPTVIPKQKAEESSIRSDIDINIPQGIGKNDNTFVVIFANEKYRREEVVLYANNDGEIFKTYCIKTLGIPEKNIKYIADASLNDLKYNLNWLKQVMEAYNGEAKAIFYYAGHGIPDEAQKTAYLLPVDGYGSDVTTGYKVDELYATLGKLPSKSVTVFLDACFSGSKRDGGMLASARGVAIKAKKSNPIGNMVVFSAAQGDETAYPYKEQRHGMFTYYLLKKLQETKGEATLGEISDYVTSEVRKQSIVINGKMQTPTLTSSSAVGDTWRNWKLK